MKTTAKTGLTVRREYTLRNGGHVSQYARFLIGEELAKIAGFKDGYSVDIEFFDNGRRGVIVLNSAGPLMLRAAARRNGKASPTLRLITSAVPHLLKQPFNSKPLEVHDVAHGYLDFKYA